MPTMKICRGDLDYADYEFNSLSQGQNLEIRGYEKKEEAVGRNISFDRPKV